MDPGHRVGVYEIGALLGAGGMGEVYRARDTRLGRAVAIKFLSRDSHRDPERLRRFTNEARAASALNHPHILTVHEIGEADERPFIAMELVEGQTLRQRLRAGGIEVAEALDIASQIALALAAAHEKGVVHRDIKPENVMLRPDGFVKVLDFGLAALRPIPSDAALTAGAFDTVAATAGGTIAYMPPEQLERHHADPRSDIFAFAVLMCELTTGTNPFARPNAIETLNAIAHTPAPAEAVTADLPPALARVITKALARRPEERYQSVREVIVDLERARRVARGETDSVDRHARSRRGAIAGLVGVVLCAASGVWLYSSFGRNRLQVDSIAVLPFVSSAGDSGTEYLSQGIATNIVNTLSQLRLPQLRVVPWSAVARYMGKHVDPQEVARTLKVHTVLVGTITQRGDELDIELELIDASRVAQLWGHRYMRPLNEIVSMQEQLAHDVANQLRIALSSDDERRLARHDTENSQAHLLYLKGRNHADKRGPEELQLARKYFQQAVDLDPKYAQAYAGLAFAETVFSRRAMIAPSEAYARARSAAAKAIQLDDQLPEAHYAAAIVKMDFERDWPGAEREFARSIALNPSVDAHHRYSHLLEALHRADESLAETRRALAIDPLDPLINAHLGWHYLSVGKFDEAIAACLKARDLGETYFVHFYLGRAYEEVKRYDEAIAELTRAHDTFKGDTEALTAMGHVYAVSGRRGEAEAVIAQLDTLAKQRYVSQGYKALIYAGLGDTERAIATLELGFNEGPEWLVYLDLDSRYESLRGDKRFQELVKRAGLLRSSLARP